MPPDFNALSYVFLALLSLQVALEAWLSTRQLRAVRRHRDRVPDAFAGRISPEAHRRAADYTLALTRLAMITTSYSALLVLAWTLGGGLEALDRMWRQWSPGPILGGTGLILGLFLINGLLELPFSVYRTFVIEKRFGFNRTTPGLFVADLVKGVLLAALLGGPLLAAILWLMDRAGPLWWLWAWGLWFGFSLFMVWAWPTLIAPLFNRFTPLQDEALRQAVERLLAQCGFEASGVYVMDGSRRSAHGNAYFTGLGRHKRIVFFDTLLEQLDPPEVEAVLAHELGHYRLHHIRKRMLAMAASSLVALAALGWLGQQPWFHAGLGYHLPDPPAAVTLALFLLAAPVVGYFLGPLMAWLSRRHEFEADAFAARLRGADTLVSALVKLYRENAATLTPDPLYSSFHDSHPPAPVRIHHLEQAAAGG